MGQTNNISVKKWGVGTLSFIIDIFSAMFSFTSLGERTIGQDILDAIGIRFPVGIVSTIICGCTGLIIKTLKALEFYNKNKEF